MSLDAKISAESHADSSNDDSDQDDMPLIKRRQIDTGSKKAAVAAIADSDDDMSEDVGSIDGASKAPASPMRKATQSNARRKRPASDEDASLDSDDSDSEDIPLAMAVAAKKAKSEPSSPVKKKVKKDVKKVAPSKLKKVAAVKKEPGAASPKKSPKKSKIDTDVEGTPKKRKKEAEEEEEVFKWWEEQDQDDSVKWDTLEHSGVFFPPEYVPHGVQMLYDGKPVKLSPESEEVAGFFAQLLETQYVENETFCQNFFEDFLQVLAENDKGCPIKERHLCDFTPMHEYFERQKEIKKAMSKEEKDVIKEEKKRIEAQYGWATIDGRREKVGNFRIEPPGLFRGRGDHPKTGKLKKRVKPEQVTINIGAEAKIPAPPEGHKWGGVVHNNTVSWLATWSENVNGNIKYIFFAAGSSLKGMSDFKKFEKARELKKVIETIRRDYMLELKDKLMFTRQRATAMWLIDRLALRAGNEKGEDEADTVGCCSLRYEHVELEEDEENIPDPSDPSKEITVKKKMVVFDFLGKDSIRYYNRVEVHPQVWKNLKIFKMPPKKEEDPLFDRLTTSMLNKHLTTLMPGLTAKVFRTYNASHTFQKELVKTNSGSSVPEKILSYNRANRQVAILCNHQRTVPKTFGQQMEKITEKILMFKYERNLVRLELLRIDPKLKKSMPELAKEDPDLDAETLKRKAAEYEEREQLKLDKRYEKMCEKAREEGRSLPEKPDLADNKRELSVERLAKKFESFTAKIEQSSALKTDKDENKTTALGTSKINYIDPRITTAWCAKHDVPIDKMFTKTLRDKFKWAMHVDEEWTF